MLHNNIMYYGVNPKTTFVIGVFCFCSIKKKFKNNNNQLIHILLQYNIMSIITKFYPE